jgi:hypothetical protein
MAITPITAIDALDRTTIEGLRNAIIQAQPKINEIITLAEANEANVTTNTANVATNTASVAANATNVAANATAIGDLETKVNNFVDLANADQDTFAEVGNLFRTALTDITALKQSDIVQLAADTALTAQITNVDSALGALIAAIDTRLDKLETSVLIADGATWDKANRTIHYNGSSAAAITCPDLGADEDGKLFGIHSNGQPLTVNKGNGKTISSDAGTGLASVVIHMSGEFRYDHSGTTLEHVA